MNNFWRSIVAGYAGWKWGGGCLGFIVVFFIVFWLLGYVHCWFIDKCWYFFSFYINEFMITAGKGGDRSLIRCGFFKSKVKSEIPDEW